MQDIEGFIQEKENLKFSGCLKMGIEKGVVRNLTELNATDLPITKPTKSLRAIIDTISDREFFGTIVLEFKNGEFVGWAYSRTFSNLSLDRLLGFDLSKM